MTAKQKVITLDYTPTEKQALFHRSSARQILYGGAAGGGKSKAIRMDAVRYCMANPGLDAYLFRRTLPELEDNHIRKLRQELPPELGTYNETKKRFEFINKSGLNFCYCEKESDVTRQQGAEIHWLGIDEAAHLTEFQIGYLKSRNRIGSFKPDPKWAHALPRCVMASNPGGPGHSYLKSIFIDQAPPQTVFHDKTMADPVQYPNGWPSLFIPARMSDNPHLDLGYEGSFGGLPEELARALREGDWDAVVGQAVPISREKHRIRPFTPPKWWTRIMAIDWGTYHPFAVGWYCISEQCKLEGMNGWPDVFLPDGAIVMYREWYGWNGKANQGCRMDSRSVARKILEIEKAAGETMDYRIADSAMWSTQDGPSVAENMQREGNGKFILRSTGGKDRAANYAEICSRLAGHPDTGPMFYATADCTHFWRTVPILTFDETNPEKGPNTNLEDHCLVGETLVRTPEGMQRIDSLPLHGVVLTSVGWREYVHLGCTIKNTDVWKIEMTDETVIEATPSHRFRLIDGRYVRLDELSYNDYLARFQEGEAGCNRFSMASRIGSAAITIRDTASAFIAKCGSIITGLFPRDSTFTTATATGPTTTYRTSNCSGPVNICATTHPILFTFHGNGRISSESDHSPLRGIPPRRALNGTASIVRGFRQILSRFILGRAASAGNRECQKSPTGDSVQGRATRKISGVGIRVITPNWRRADVFNLHVPGPNDFTIQGGLIVHNCYDQWAYLCRSRPYRLTKEDRYWAQVEPLLAARKGPAGRDPYATR